MSFAPLYEQTHPVLKYFTPRSRDFFLNGDFHSKWLIYAIIPVFLLLLRIYKIKLTQLFNKSSFTL